MAETLSPYIVGHFNSVLEFSTVLTHLLKPVGYSKNDINDMVIASFLENERIGIQEPTSMHLLALKKSLLYTIPVISTPQSNTGISLTSQVTSTAIQYNKGIATQCRLNVGDKFRLLGLSFQFPLVNHIDYTVYPWKFLAKFPLCYNQPFINFTNVEGVEMKSSKLGNIYLFDSHFYENVELFNHINRVIAYVLLVEFSSLIRITNELIRPEILPDLQRIKPLNDSKWLGHINNVLSQQIDNTFNMTLYETLHITKNWLLYDNLNLLGIGSPEVNQHLKKLQYIKNQTRQVLHNTRISQQRLLLETRAEKITRERYPYYFDYTDRRAIFIRFNRFSLDKLPIDKRKDVYIILEKEIASQNAILKNNCAHISQQGKSFDQISKYVDYDSIDENKMYSCKLCRYPLICVHELELHEIISSIDISNDNSDNLYWVRQTIINKYKLVDQKNKGDESTESVFTYYCKHCGGELGKSADIIQSTIKTQIESSGVLNDEIDQTIFITVASIINSHVDSYIVHISKKMISKIIFNEIKEEIRNRLKYSAKREQTQLDVLTRYLSTVFTLVGLVSLNVNTIKSNKSIFINNEKHIKEDSIQDPSVVGGSIIKDELIVVLNIVQSISIFKRIGVTSDKIKALIIDAFKCVNNMFSGELVSFKSTSHKDRLVFDIKSGSLAQYVVYVYNYLNKKKVTIDQSLDILGIQLDTLFPKNKKQHLITSHALYKDIYNPSMNKSTDIHQYILESYKTIADYASMEPIIGKYTSFIAPPVSDFIKTYETNKHKELLLKRLNPVRHITVENTREYDFKLNNYQLAYCMADIVRPHRWIITRNTNKLSFVCELCQIDITSARDSANEKIESSLHEQMIKEAFFELYTLTCPVKDAHIYDAGKCIHCNVTKMQIENRDLSYYKKYSYIYKKYREAITMDLLDNAKSIRSNVSDYKHEIVHVQNISIDLDKLESLASNLSKLYSNVELLSIGKYSENERSLDIIESYVRLFYSHYTFAKNVSIDTKDHPDVYFFSFIKETFFNGVKPKLIALPPLPPYPISNNADTLLCELLQIMFDLTSKGDTTVNQLIQFIITKISKQHQRHQAYNFAKLKAIVQIEMIEEDEINEIENEEEFDMFNGYDMDVDDIEDNIDGDYVQ